MKELYIGANNTHIQIDPENKQIVDTIDTGYCVKRMYAIQEPTHIIYKTGETQICADADAGDVVIIFYHNEFTNELVVVKNEQIYNNLIDKHNKEQQQKEEWAKSKCCGCKCEDKCSES